jgi:PAS domain S-box-containing protein
LVWSDGFFRLLGIEPAACELPGAGGDLFFDRVHPEDRTYVRERWARALAGDMEPTHYRVVLPDGTLRHVRGQGTVEKASDGSAERIIGTLVDVTDLQQALEDLGRANAVLAETQHAAGVGTYVYEPASQTSEWSDELYRIYGLDRKTLITRDLTQAATLPEDRERHKDWSRRLLEGERVPPLFLRIRRPDGSIRHTESRGRRFVDERGVVRVVGICLDLTSRVELEARLREAAKMEAVGTLAAGVAHDFNNFLTVILCQLEELRDVSAPTQKAALEDARLAAEQCALLTEKLLAFARKQPPVLGPLELGAIVRRVEALLRRVCPPQLTVSVELPNAPVYLQAEENQLESLLMNLALNARDAMPDGGSLAFTVDEVELGAGALALDPDCSPGRYTRIRVSDSGSGIAPEHLSRIFEPYFSTKTIGQGTGLGLASAYGCVRQHGGSIRVESKTGRGTTFSVYLPSAAPARARPSAARPPALASLLQGRHVLVVEDVDVVRRTVVTALQRAGARVTAVIDGWYALEFLAGDASVDVVLTDLVMPRMGGLQLARELHKLRPELPVAFMSGYADNEVVESIARDHPDQPLLRKPFAIEELTRALAAVLSRTPGKP